MNKNVALALAAGILGGMLTRYISPPTAYAQNQAPPTAPVEIKRRVSFSLTNRTGLLERSAQFPVRLVRLAGQSSRA